MFMVLYGVIYHTSCKMSTFFQNYFFEVSSEPEDPCCSLADLLLYKPYSGLGITYPALIGEPENEGLPQPCGVACIKNASRLLKEVLIDTRKVFRTPILISGQIEQRITVVKKRGRLDDAVLPTVNQHAEIPKMPVCIADQRVDKILPEGLIITPDSPHSTGTYKSANRDI